MIVDETSDDRALEQLIWRILDQAAQSTQMVTERGREANCCGSRIRAVIEQISHTTLQKYTTFCEIILGRSGVVRESLELFKCRLNSSYAGCQEDGATSGCSRMYILMVKRDWLAL
ncbi:hypothetical protein BK648_22890 [Pseudomonas poae]|uniref:Uncharacterized protein n=1 Tax=Pseudomonas poae TaxID=200451 RepID=A0A423EQR0_9PSED|nr:hypothetical protein BK648_22890 [Pseudomonas poae]